MQTVLAVLNWNMWSVWLKLSIDILNIILLRLHISKCLVCYQWAFSNRASSIKEVVEGPEVSIQKDSGASEPLIRLQSITADDKPPFAHGLLESCVFIDRV